MQSPVSPDPELGMGGGGRIAAVLVAVVAPAAHLIHMATASSCALEGFRRRATLQTSTNLQHLSVMLSRGARAGDHEQTPATVAEAGTLPGEDRFDEPHSIPVQLQRSRVGHGQAAMDTPQGLDGALGGWLPEACRECWRRLVRGRAPSCSAWSLEVKSQLKQCPTVPCHSSRPQLGEGTVQRHQCAPCC